MSLSHRVRLVSAVTIAAVTAGLLLRSGLSRRILPSPSVPAPAPATAPSPIPQISPAWKIAYPCGGDICLAHPGDSAGKPILRQASQPSWSPDRKRLAFERGGNVWISDADGSAQRQITFWPTGTHDFISGISWDTRDNLLSFGRSEKLSVTFPGGATHQIQGTTLFHASLAGLPRGSHPNPRFPFAVPAHLTPTSWEDDGDDIPNPLAPRFDITENHTPFVFGNNTYPAWSASGEELAWARNGDIWLATREANMWDATRIVASADYDDSTIGGSRWTISATDISWAPDGSYLVFCNRRINGTGENDLYIVRKRTSTDEDGDKSIQYDDDFLATSRPGYSPSVSPDGKWILFTTTEINAPSPSLKAVTPDGKNECTLLNNASSGVW